MFYYNVLYPHANNVLLLAQWINKCLCGICYIIYGIFKEFGESHFIKMINKRRVDIN